jgi:hypothetical protein
MVAVSVPAARAAAPAAEGVWARFFPRWCAGAALVLLGLPVVFFGALGVADSDEVLGPAYAELLQASRAVGAYRLAMVFDALGWAMIGGTLLVLGRLLERQAPVRAAFVSACAVGQVAGVLGGFLRLDGYASLAERYPAATPEQLTALLDAFLALQRVVGACFHAGNLLQGAGFALAAWALLSLPGFPRWLAVWMVLPGVLPLAQFVNVATGAPFSFPLILFHVVVGIIALHVAIAVALRRPSAALTEAVNGVPVER